MFSRPAVRWGFGIALLVWLGSASALAQAPPDAGQILQQSQPETIAPRAPSVELDLRGEPLIEESAGGQRITLTGVRFEGNTRFTSGELTQRIGDHLDEPQDLAGLRHLANEVSRFYHDHGYPFARALLPAQSLDDGVLLIQVVEGRYGRVDATGDDAELVAAARPYLTPLSTGRLIESATLERRMLLLGDLPGVAVIPVMRPGDEMGRGDLEVRVSEAERMTLQVGADNHGSRYSGEYRGRVGVAGRRLLSVGDELSLSALYSNEATWLGSVRYSLPLGASGLRGALSYAHTDYSLGRGFEGYRGTAAIYSAELSYPLVRRQRANVALSARYQYKDLDDTVDFADYRKATESHGLPLGVQFDARDSVGRGGVTYGRLTLTPGTLKQSQRLSRIELPDADYGFAKANLDVARLQALGRGIDLHGRFEAQWADRGDLDGSESFDLGGPHGVRAFPVGEGLDSRGWLAQLELRYRAGHGLAPYLFYDLGRTPDGGIDSGDARSLAGAGVGLRYRRAGLDLDVASAWEVRGGDALSDDRQRDPRLWATAAYRF
ncbi:ShlB/FhaC/HecB family hemolysin secretion/activation protein [Billgrantia endophytica]|uniref:ShlB/FhaC/HecB family hemolysin secretion/activation protein n=2 Tax=Billgrantia endophytica TaxID=2033802 RepID=A0A2N7U6E4_9GAMM|nr:ShlB/FhaC/HecB family hemolysin secretion/activation protein [Halomonas endophytica]